MALSYDDASIVLGMAARGDSDQDIAAWLASGDIEWWGERQDMPAVYAACHAVVLPSPFAKYERAQKQQARQQA